VVSSLASQTSDVCVGSNFSVRTGCVFVKGLIGVGMDGEVKGPTAKNSWNYWGCDDSLWLDV
jgi:hypothetical protein